MPSPSSALSTLRPDLAASFTQFDLAMDRQGFIATKVAPVMDVANSSGTFGVMPLGQLLTPRETKRAPGAEYGKSKSNFDTASYITHEYGAEEVVDDNDRKNYRNYFDSDLIAAQKAYDAVLRGMEIRTAALFSSFTTATSGVGTTWKTWATCDPVADIELAVQTVYANSGMWPNTLILTRTQFRNLRECAKIVDRVKYSGLVDPTAKGITAGVLAQVFDLPNVVIAGSTTNTAAEGQTASLSSLWSNDAAYVCYINGGNDFGSPTVARIFHWGADGSSIGGTVEQYRNEGIRGDVFRVRNQVVEKGLYAALSYKLTGCTT